MIKKALLVVGVMIVMLSLASCMFVDAMSAVLSDKDALVDKKAQEIVAALDARDGAALKGVFSEEALSQATDMDEGIAYVFGIYTGSSIEVSGSYSEWNHYGEPGNTTKAIAYYDVKTEAESYTLIFEYWIIDNANPRAQGVYRLRLSTPKGALEIAEEIEALREAVPDTPGASADEWNYGASYNRPGIYHPGWSELKAGE